MDTQTYQYETSFELYHSTEREEASTTDLTPVQPSEPIEYWVFDNGICG